MYNSRAQANLSSLKAFSIPQWRSTYEESLYCRIWAVRASRLLGTLLRVHVSVHSISAWVSNSSLNGGCTWRPVRSFSSGQVRSWWPTPCQLVSSSCGSPMHSIVYALALRSSISCQLWSPTLALCRVVWIVCSLELACQVCWFSAFHTTFASLKLALRTSCRSTWLVSILGRRADRSCDSNSVRSNHSAWSPTRHPGKSPLY